MRKTTSLSLTGLPYKCIIVVVGWWCWWHCRSRCYQSDACFWIPVCDGFAVAAGTYYKLIEVSAVYGLDCSDRAFHAVSFDGAFAETIDPNRIADIEFVMNCTFLYFFITQ